MKKMAQTLVAMTIIGMLLLAGSAPAAAAREVRILQFDTMVGVPQALTGAQSQGPLRGLNGGGIPWTLKSGRGFLTASGHLKIEVEGLVLAAGANAGTNPISSFRAILSCLNADGTPNNIVTAAFPATTGAASSGGGDSEIETNIVLPQTCIAPIIFVTSPGNSWFAATGF